MPKPTIYLYEELQPEAKKSALDRYRREEILNYHNEPGLRDVLAHIADVSVEKGPDEAVKILAEHFSRQISSECLEYHIKGNEYLFNADGDMVEVKIVN